MSRPLPFPDLPKARAKKRRRNPSPEHPPEARKPGRPKDADHREGDLFSFAVRREEAAGAGGPVDSQWEEPFADPGGMTTEGLLDILSRHLDGDRLGGTYCRGVVEELGCRRETRAVPLLTRLCQRFAGYDRSHPSAEMLAAMNSLATIGDPSAARVVTELAASEAIGPASTAVALRYLATIRHCAAAPLARRHLRNDDPAVRRAACELAGSLGLGEETETLHELVSDVDQGVARAAALALGRMGYRPVKERLEVLLAKAMAVDVPAFADALVAVADNDTAVLLGRTVERVDEAGRCAIAQALGQMEVHAAVPVLCRMAQDPRPAVRAAVAHGLEERQGSRVGETLRMLARDSNPEVGNIAETALLHFADDGWEP